VTSALRQRQLAHELVEQANDEDILRDRILLAQPRRLMTSFFICLDMTGTAIPIYIQWSCSCRRGIRLIP
jgi:hypothetical protein